jgi:hypothetical protein
MAEKERLVKAIHRLVSDKEFRRRLMVTPREVLMVELGISGEAYDALVGLAPILLAGGLSIVGGGLSPELDAILQPRFGGWGRG